MRFHLALVMVVSALLGGVGAEAADDVSIVQVYR